MVSECKTWISIDSFLPHMVNNMEEIVTGNVIFGLSDPKIYGYPYNNNILKSEQLLRPDKFGIWNFEQNPDVFETPEIIFSKLKL